MTEDSLDYVALTKKVWAWIEKPESERDIADLEPYEELLADDVVFEVDGPRDASSPTFPGSLVGKQAVLDYLEPKLTGQPMPTKELELERPLEFVASGQRVVVLGAERYTIVLNGLEVRHKETASVVDFRDGLIVRIRQIGDISEYVASYADQPVAT